MTFDQAVEAARVILADPAWALIGVKNRGDERFALEAAHKQSGYAGYFTSVEDWRGCPLNQKIARVPAHLQPKKERIN